MSKKTITEVELVALGTQGAKAFMESDNVANQTKRKVLLSLASEIVALPEVSQQETVLTAYAKTFADAGQVDGTVRMRKTELKAVCDAVAVDKKHHNTLETMKGGYHEFIKKARDLRDSAKAKSDTGSKPRTVRAKKLTANQQDKVEQAIEIALPEQTFEIGESVVKQLNNTQPQLAGYNSFRLIQLTALQITRNKQIDSVFREAADKIMDIVDEVIKQAQQASDEATKATTKAKEKPAEQPATMH